MRYDIRKSRLGFSLVEVVVALGIAAIAMLSVVGLLSAAMDTSGDAGQDTALAAMSSQVIGDLHSAPFDSLGQASPKTPVTIKATLPAILADSIYYFTIEGVPINNNNGTAVPADAEFECIVRKKVDESYRSIGGGPYNLVQVELFFSWPATGNADPEKRPGKATFHASIARY